MRLGVRVCVGGVLHTRTGKVVVCARAGQKSVMSCETFPELQLSQELLGSTRIGGGL